MKEQSINAIERFYRYKSKNPNISLEQYLKERNISIDDALNSSIYSGQYRIVPPEQFEEITKLLRRKIAENIHRPEQARRYKETLDLLLDCARDEEGNRSIELTKDSAEKLAILSKRGIVSAEELEKLGVTNQIFLDYEQMIKQAFNSGISAAMYSFLLKFVPLILNEWKENRAIYIEDVSSGVGKSLTDSGESFFRASIASFIAMYFKSGLAGDALKKISPSQIGLATVLAMNTLKNTLKVLHEEYTPAYILNELIKDSLILFSSGAGGILCQIYLPIPVLGYLLGNFLGSIIGTVIYQGIQSFTLGLCLNTGITMFGLVKQDYELPDDVLEQIGIEVFDFNHFEPNKFSFQEFMIEEFSFDEFSYEEFSIIPLRRGVIGINTIGYI